MAFLTFREMQRQVQAKIQNTGTSTTNANDLLPKVKDWINERYYRLYRSFYWKDTLETYDLTLTASTAEYAFNRDVYEIVSIFDETNAYVISEDTIQNHMRHYAVDYDKAGNIINDDPARYRLIGTHTVKAAIGTSGEKIDVVSTDNSTDISPNSVHIEGLVNGVQLQENVTLTGTTPATSTNTYDASQKLRISVGTTDGSRKTVVGAITVDGNTSGTVFSEITPSEYAQKYIWFSNGDSNFLNILYCKIASNNTMTNDITIPAQNITTHKRP